MSEPEAVTGTLCLYLGPDADHQTEGSSPSRSGPAEAHAFLLLGLRGLVRPPGRRFRKDPKPAGSVHQHETQMDTFSNTAASAP